MSPFVATNKVPGVYIDEIDVPGGVSGVATSVVAIVGPALSGLLNTPKRVTSPTEFEQEFGGYIYSPMVYATHAVHGFFANGGSQCYFVRVGTAQKASLTLLDRSAAPAPTLLVTAVADGLKQNDVTVAVQDANIAATAATRATADLAGAGAQNASAEVDDATPFRADDIVLVDDGAVSERATVATTTATTITFKSNLANVYAAGTVRIADLEVGQTTFRVDSAAGIEPGSALEITDGTDTDTALVAAVNYGSGFVTLQAGLGNAYTMSAGDPPVAVETLEFTLVVTDADGVAQNFVNLSLDPRHSRYVGSAVSSTAVVVSAAEPPNPTPPPDNRPEVLAATNLAGGTDDDLTTLGPGHYQAGIDALRAIDEVTLLCVPDRTDLAVQSYMITHCEQMQDRFAILDPGPNLDRDGVLVQRGQLASDRGFGALYYPRIKIQHLNELITIPPSGHIAGVFANTDDKKGVHKAPANEKIAGVLGLERALIEADQGLLNERSVNVLRFLPGRGHRIWGARTLATGTQWRYVNVRRLMLFIEESVQEATEFAVFEPNGTPLWESLKRMVSEFLTRLWSDGMLVGTTPEQGFRVRIDEELNPPSLRELGQLVIEVRVAPTTPAEFIVFRVIQTPGRPLIDE
jgi:uncharacterized protein